MFWRKFSSVFRFEEINEISTQSVVEMPMGKRYGTHVHRGDHYCERKQLYHDSRISEMLLKKIKK